ncbi:uncharacterized protein LOC116870966 [Lontra canadensis]|uniref:uncharacterized protein LOC116870966 n=1 Tax=Lontra canadensis TaxID=76717 RepID=UPI0013F328A5|nr:uncharacterized protein LOC116870966 [Lontra canadensis]
MPLGPSCPRRRVGRGDAPSWEDRWDWLEEGRALRRSSFQTVGTSQRVAKFLGCGPCVSVGTPGTGPATRACGPGLGWPAARPSPGHWEERQERGQTRLGWVPWPLPTKPGSPARPQAGGAVFPGTPRNPSCLETLWRCHARVSSRPAQEAWSPGLWNVGPPGPPELLKGLTQSPAGSCHRALPHPGPGARGVRRRGEERACVPDPALECSP